VNLDDLISVAQREPLKVNDIDRAAMQVGASPAEVLDMVSRRIAEGYANAEYDFALCDAVMNRVFQYATNSTDFELSRFAWGVFEAFDQGEFRGEEVTRSLIAAILSRGYLVLGDGLGLPPKRSEPT